MPPITRSSELLEILDGLFFIDQDVIDLASKLYSELRSSMATFGEGSIEKLVPHISSLMTKLNDLSRMNCDLHQEVEVLRSDLSSAENRCMDLDNSYKGMSAECCEREDEYEADILRLNTQLAKSREEYTRFQQTVNQSVAVDADGLLQKTLEKVAILTAERQCLLTTIEVLEADVKCLRAEVRRMESRARQRRTSAADDLLAEIALADKICGSSPSASRPPPAPQTSQPPYNIDDLSRDTADILPGPLTPPTQSGSRPSEFGEVLLIGDSHLRYTCKKCVYRGAYLECCPGANNLKKGYRGGPGYNGGHGKREALHSMADLLYTAKQHFPNSKIFLNSVLIRRDINYKALHDFNVQLDLMCNNFGVEFVEANCCVGKRDLTRDGVHFNRRGVSRLGSLFVDAISAALRCLDAAPASFQGDQGEATPVLSSGPESEIVVNGEHLSRESLDTSLDSGN